MEKEQLKTLLVNVLVIIGVVTAFSVGYFFFANKTTPDLGLQSSSKAAQSTATIGEEITRTVEVLQALDKSVKNSAAIFHLPAFENLEDFSVEVPHETVWRDNPFLPTQWKLNNLKTSSATSRGWQSSAGAEQGGSQNNKQLKNTTEVPMSAPSQSPTETGSMNGGTVSPVSAI